MTDETPKADSGRETRTPLEIATDESLERTRAKYPGLPESDLRSLDFEENYCQHCCCLIGFCICDDGEAT
jgi:hypothetical protein